MLYYEILAPTRPTMNRPSLEPGIYADDVCLVDGETVFGVVSYCANRIWREQDGTVTYLKKKHVAGDDVNWTVDMTEFLFIKLKAKEL